MRPYSLGKEKIKQSIFEESFLSLSDVPKDYPSRVVGAEEKIYNDWVMQLIKKQSHREVVKMRIAGLTCKQIACFAGVSFQRIWQIYNQAVEEIKTKVKDQDLHDVLKLLESSGATNITALVSDGDVDKRFAERDAENKAIFNKIYYEKNKDIEIAYGYFCSKLGLKRADISDDLLRVKVESLKLKRAIKEYRRKTNG